MSYLEKLLIDNWPTWVIIVFTAGGVYRRIVSTEKKVSEMKKDCKARFTWCLDHFKVKEGSE